MLLHLSVAVCFCWALAAVASVQPRECKPQAARLATPAIKLCTDVMAYSTDAYQTEIEHEEHYGHIDTDPDNLEGVESYFSESYGLVTVDALRRCTQRDFLKSDGWHC